MERQKISRENLEAFIAACVTGAPENTVTAETAKDPADIGTAIYDAPLVCIGRADDPLWEQFKQPDAIGDIYRTPREWLPEAKTVISVFAPFTDYVRQSNAAEPVWPGSAWVSAYRTGGALIKRVSVQLADWLNAQGIPSVAPGMTEAFRFIYEKGFDPEYPELSYVSNWSERHAAFVCGHGTFGLSRGIITKRGMAGRFSSVVTELELEPDKRPYEGLYDYCIRCGKCIENCPADAISFEEGKQHPPCDAWLTEGGARGYSGCGKCQVNVPCGTGIPAPAFRKRDNI